MMAYIPDAIARDISSWLRRSISFPGTRILEQWADILESSCEDEHLEEYQEAHKTVV